MLTVRQSETPIETFRNLLKKKENILIVDILEKFDNRD